MSSRMSIALEQALKEPIHRPCVRWADVAPAISACVKRIWVT